MTYILDYRDEPQINCVFHRLGTPQGLRRWTEPKPAFSYTIVSYIQEYNLRLFQDAINIVSKTGHGFKPLNNLHCTLLSLKESPSEQEIQSILYHTKNFFDRKSLRQSEANFDIIHPGKDNKYPEVSDNAVIALARIHHCSNRLFLTMIHGLEDYLIQRSYPELIEKHKADTIWCTLGYFNEPQFKVDYETYNAFNKLRSFSASVICNEVVMTKYRLKSLDDGQPLTKIKL
jgi:hypothetical protein